LLSYPLSDSLAHMVHRRRIFLLLHTIYKLQRFLSFCCIIRIDALYHTQESAYAKPNQSTKYCSFFLHLAIILLTNVL